MSMALTNVLIPDSAMVMFIILFVRPFTDPNSGLILSNKIWF